MWDGFFVLRSSAKYKLSINSQGDHLKEVITLLLRLQAATRASQIYKINIK